MGECQRALGFELGRIVVRSWEHTWLTGISEVRSVAEASRLLPPSTTEPLYELLTRLERALIRDTLPFPPFDVRLHVGHRAPIPDDEVSDLFAQYWPIDTLCPMWDEVLRRKRLLLRKGPREQVGRYGQVLRVPTGNTPLLEVYEVRWVALPFQPETLDDLLRKYSPRHKEPSLFETIEAIREASERYRSSPGRL